MSAEIVKSLDKSNCYMGLKYLKEGHEMLGRWTLLLVGFFVFPCLLSIPYVIDMVRNGGIGFLAAFAAVFIYCVWVNGMLLYRISLETDVLRKFYTRLKPNIDFEEQSNSILAVHVRNLNLIWQRSGKKHSRQDTLIEVLHAKLKNEGSVVILASSIMITLGLLGTVSGLISSIGGLQSTSGVDGLMGGVSKAIDGMGIAFYTTLIGSMLGGITLRVLHYYVDKQVDSFVFTMAEMVETRIIPSLRLAERTADLRDIALATVSALREMNLLKENKDESAKFALSA